MLGAETISSANKTLFFYCMNVWQGGNENDTFKANDSSKN